MRVEEFDYELPHDRIAQHPIEPRDSSRLLILDRLRAVRHHSEFARLPEWLRAGDLLVLNDTRVFPARVRGLREGGGEVEVLLVELEERTVEGEIWTCLVRPGRRVRPGGRVRLAGGLEGVWLEGKEREGLRRLRFRPGPRIAEALEEAGEVPLPPYIERPPTDADRSRYQTVYARVPGAVAAPTAGLHFTPDLLGRLERTGIEIRSLTLHVGPGTFQPIRGEIVEEHRLLPEHVEIPAETAAAVRRAKAERRRVIAVGTTAVRALEGLCAADPPQTTGRVSLFIVPGFRFQVVDALVTNFHLPRSTLLMLVAAFAGREQVLDAYRDAIERGYRFYSYGDAMLIL